MTVSRRVGLFGGMFDPIHAGHIDVLTAAHAALSLTELIVLPANVPPHRPPPVASSYHRFAMTALAIAGRPGWQVSDLELVRDGASYTSDTLRDFQTQGLDRHELFFIIGADAFLEIATWKDYPSLLEAAHFAVISRAGVGVHELPHQLPALASRMCAPVALASSSSTMILLIDARTRDVSSTAIRRARWERQPIAGMVPLAVQQHIEQHGLYENRTIGLAPDSSSAGLPAGTLHGRN